MLARKNRLTGRQNYKRVQKEGRVLQSLNFGLAYVDRSDNDPSRFGFIVSTKIAKDAVDRNRIKRAMSEAVRLVGFSLKSGFDVIFLAKPSIVKVSTENIMKEIKGALKAGSFLE